MSALYYNLNNHYLSHVIHSPEKRANRDNNPEKIMKKPLDTTEQNRIAALYELKILDTPADERFDRIIRLTSGYLSVPIAFISFIDSKHQWFKSSCGIGLNKISRNDSFCHYTIQQSKPMIIPDALLDERFCNNPYVTNSPNIRFYAGFPLSTVDGFNVGTLCAIDKKPRNLDETEIQILKDLATLAEDQVNLLDISLLERAVREKNISLTKAKKELEMRNNFIRKVFGSFMSDEIVAALLESKSELKLGGEERKITILFSDLRNFTTLSEHFPADKIVAALNNHYGKMVDVIEKYNGTVDSFIGDAIMVVFGAPHSGGDDAYRAIACALEMQATMQEVNAMNRNNSLPELAMGIGINTGYAIVGNIGSQKRMQYSAIGSPVNLASRIQDLTLGGQILISEATYQEVSHSLELNGHLRVKVKGIAAPITIYDVIGLGKKTDS
ncbi:adenylate/guanylate cyclase domain-containing protein [Legionella pneumophila serogroup 1]